MINQEEQVVPKMSASKPGGFFFSQPGPPTSNFTSMTKPSWANPNATTQGLRPATNKSTVTNDRPYIFGGPSTLNQPNQFAQVSNQVSPSSSHGYWSSDNANQQRFINNPQLNTSNPSTHKEEEVITTRKRVRTIQDSRMCQPSRPKTPGPNCGITGQGSAQASPLVRARDENQSSNPFTRVSPQASNNGPWFVCNDRGEVKVVNDQRTTHELPACHNTPQLQRGCWQPCHHQHDDNNNNNNHQTGDGDGGMECDYLEPPRPKSQCGCPGRLQESGYHQAMSNRSQQHHGSCNCAMVDEDDMDIEPHPHFTSRGHPPRLYSPSTVVRGACSNPHLCRMSPHMRQLVLQHPQAQVKKKVLYIEEIDLDDSATIATSKPPHQCCGSGIPSGTLQHSSGCRNLPCNELRVREVASDSRAFDNRPTLAYPRERQIPRPRVLLRPRHHVIPCHVEGSDQASRCRTTEWQSSASASPGTSRQYTAASFQQSGDFGCRRPAENSNNVTFTQNVDSEMKDQDEVIFIKTQRADDR